MCAVLGEGIIILPGLVICDDKGAMRIPVKNTGQRFYEVMQDQTIGTFSLRDDGSLTVYSLVDGESVEGGKPGSTVSTGLMKILEEVGTSGRYVLIVERHVILC